MGVIMKMGMKPRSLALALAMTMAGAGCTLEGQEDQLENSIRQNLSGQGNVQQVELTKQGDGSFTGFAVVRRANGIDNRLNCTAQPTAGSTSNFNWRCLSAVDEATLQEMENAIRENLARQATVLEVDLDRQDDNSMIGFARVRDANGNEIRTECTATRENPESSNFQWACRPREAAAGAQSPSAAAGEGDKDASADGEQGGQ